MDPSGGTIGYVTKKVLDEVISRLEKVIRCKRDCATLKHLVMKLKHHVNKAIKLLQLEFGVHGISFIFVINLNSMQNWLQDYEKTLEEANKIVTICGKSKLKWFFLMHKYQTTKSIIYIT
jgi:hypothetical protein